MGIIVFIGILVLVIIGVILYVKVMRNQPSDENLAALVKIGVTDAEPYAQQMTKRKGLSDYLLDKIGSTSADQLALSNFHIMTANLGGFFSPVTNAAFCKEAIQYVIQAGARCIVFDIWPNLNKGAKMGPILAVRKNDDSSELYGSAYYTLDLVTAFTEVRKWAFEDSANPGNQDPMFLFLRFRGTYLTANTLTGTANAISQALEQYRLPFNYSSTTNNPLFTTPINADVLRRKIIILSNQTGVFHGVKTLFTEYVNSADFKDSIVTPSQMHTIITNPATLANLDKATTTKLMACAPLPEDTDKSESNAWEWKQAQNAGIQFCGLNLWVHDDGLNAYLDPGMFGTYSFSIKSGIPPSVEGFASRYTIERVPPPIPVKPLGYGDGTVTIN